MNSYRMHGTPLPPHCDRCRIEGDWVESPDGGYVRCECPRGRVLQMGVPRWLREQKAARRRNEHRAKLSDGKAMAGQTFE